MLIRPVTALLHSILLFAPLSSVLVGCRATGMPATDNEPAFSKLAGRWWISLGEIVESVHRDKTAADASRFAKEDRLLVVTILPDGSCDWSRTYLGVRVGLHGLRDAGDRCIVRKSTQSAYEVIASEYTPTTGRIEFQRIDPETRAPHSSGHYILEISLRSDGKANYVEKEVTRRSSSRNPLVLRLHRSNSTRSPIINQSRIAGSWSLGESDSEAVLVIRSDGTFDWSGTLEAHMSCWHQLEHEGDRSCNLMNHDQVYEVISGEYASVESSLRFRVRDRSPKGEATEVRVELTAKRIDEKTIRVSFDVDAGDQGGRSNTMELHKNATTQLRVGNVWRSLLGPSDSQDSDN